MPKGEKKTTSTSKQRTKDEVSICFKNEYYTCIYTVQKLKRKRQKRGQNEIKRQRKKDITDNNKKILILNE